ncbi:MAG: DEAD/DEAH box helicase [Candidatus Woesearchaeota archaeon]
MDSFRKLGIIEPVIRAIDELKFKQPTEIQRKAIPIILQGKDIVAGSATGSGKTLIFATKIIQECERGKGIQALVLTPTRELAVQITKAIRTFSKYYPIEVACVYGGVGLEQQEFEIRRAVAVVATPGRLLDHMQRGSITLSDIKVLVIDEADRMFDMGFIQDVERIISRCPKKRQSLLFSATISTNIVDLARKHMHNPARIYAESYVDPRKLKQVYYDVREDLKLSLLVHLLRREKVGLAMVFCNTKEKTDFVAESLKLNGIRALGIHGGFSQDKRNRTMDEFHKQRFNVLVCTDVAARGLDIKGVTQVYNYDIPRDSKQYIHRIGRTARAGSEGIAINLLSQRDHENFSRVLRDNAVEIVKTETPYITRVKGAPFHRKERSLQKDNGKNRTEHKRLNYSRYHEQHKMHKKSHT